MMTKVKSFFCILLVLLSVLSCSDHDSSGRKQLVYAQEIMESNPTQALALLDSIDSPKNMGEEAYMQYIVACVEAKRRNNISVTSDTVIFEAQTYFNHKGEPKQATMANYYAGKVCSQAKIWDRAINCYRQAIQYASKTEDNLILGKSYHSLGIVFYENNLLDSAIVSFHQAFDWYQKTPNVDLYKIQVLTYIGLSYDLMYKFDEAESYFKQSFELANQTGNRLFQGYGNQNLGVVCLGRKDYRMALDYFQKALPNMDNTVDSIRLYLNLSKLYTETHKLDSVAYYAEIVKKSLPQITDNRTLAYTYSILQEYNKKEKNFEEALHYTLLSDSVRQIINNHDFITQLNKAEIRREIAIENKEASHKRDMQICWIILGNVVLILSLLSIIAYFRLHSKMHQQELEHTKDELEKARMMQRMKKKLNAERSDSFQFSATIHYKTMRGWQEINKMIAESELDGDKREEMLRLYPRMEKVINHIHKQTSYRLVLMGKDFINTEPNGVVALKFMKNHDILTLMLAYYNFPIHAMELILGKPLSLKELQGNLYAIQVKLRVAKFSEKRIQELLFSGDLKKYLD